MEEREFWREGYGEIGNWERWGEVSRDIEMVVDSEFKESFRVCER